MATYGIPEAEVSAREPDIGRLIEAARAGSRAALGELFEASRRYLLAVAGVELPSPVQVKVAASDVVQETYLEAQQIFAKFNGHTREELFAWLRQILLNNVVDTQRFYQQTAKRDLRLEVPLWRYRKCPTPLIAPPNDSPSTRLAGEETRQMMVAWLDELPEDYRRVIVLRHQEGASFGEIAQKMDRSEAAARKLWLRALGQIRQRVADTDDVV